MENSKVCDSSAGEGEPRLSCQLIMNIQVSLVNVVDRKVEWKGRKYIPAVQSYLVFSSNLVSFNLLSLHSSFCFRKVKWSAGELLLVIEEPRNLWGSSSMLLSNTFSPLPSRRKNLISVNFPPWIDKDLHLEDLNVSPIDSAFFWMSSIRF